MNILVVGDIVGEPGRRAVAVHLPDLVAREAVDLVIANAENAAGGFGITPKIAEELLANGAHVLTGGNHIWDKKEIVDYIQKEPRLLRPANYPDGTPGQGRVVVQAASGERVGVLHVMGRIFMPPLDCPFRTATREVAWLKTQARVIIVDMHGEATSEKMAMGWHLDGEVAAVVGTHTHVQTADEQILPRGTAYLTDIGMTGPTRSVIGMEPAQVLERFLTQMPRRFEVATGPPIFQAVLIRVDSATGRALKIRRIQRTEEANTR